MCVCEIEIEREREREGIGDSERHKGRAGVRKVRRDHRDILDSHHLLISDL